MIHFKERSLRHFKGISGKPSLGITVELKNKAVYGKMQTALKVLLRSRMG